MQTDLEIYLNHLSLLESTAGEAQYLKYQEMVIRMQYLKDQYVWVLLPPIPSGRGKIVRN